MKEYNGVDDAGDVAYVNNSANHDATIIAAHAATIADVVADPVIVDASGVSPSKAHEKRNRP